jgi:hypothetical protein
MMGTVNEAHMRDLLAAGGGDGLGHDDLLDDERATTSMAGQTMEKLGAIKTIMKLCFHQDDIDQTIDALVTLGVKPDLIAQATSSAKDGPPNWGDRTAETAPDLDG